MAEEVDKEKKTKPLTFAGIHFQYFLLNFLTLFIYRINSIGLSIRF